MNSRIQEILKKQAKKNHSDCDIRLITFMKPDVISCTNPAISVDDHAFFYTFDGRSFMLNKEHTAPYISVPLETKAMQSLKGADGKVYVFSLNSCQKLEYAVQDEFWIGTKYTLTRNVQQFIKVNNSMYYAFKKEDKYFINEVAFENTHFIGKHICPFLKAKTLMLFAGQDDFMYIADGHVYTSSHALLPYRGVFAYCCEGLIVVANPYIFRPEDGAEVMGMEIKLLNETMELIGMCEIKTMYECKIRAAPGFIVLLTENIFHILQFSKEGIKSMGTREPENQVVDFDLKLAANILSIYVLEVCKSSGDEACCYAPLPIPMTATEALTKEEGAQVCASSSNGKELTDAPASGLKDVSTLIGQTPVACDSLLAVERNITNGALEEDTGLDSSPDASAELSSCQYGTLEYGLEALKVSTCNNLVDQPLKNHLYDAVRQAMVDKKKDLSAVPASATRPASADKPGGAICPDLPKGTEPKTTDRFEKYAKGLSAPDSGAGINAVDAKDGAHISAELPPSTAKQSDFQTKDPSTPRKGDGQSASNRAKPVLKKQIVSDSLAAEIESIICSSLEMVIFKNEEFIKSLILKALVPSIEATMNEMRVQIIAEFRRMDFTSKLDPVYSKNMAFKKLINSGQVNAALHELVKLKGGEFEALLPMLQPGVIENVDANILAQFISKVHIALKRGFKDQYAKLIADSLHDIEVGELGIDGLQSLSASLRYLKETPQIATPSFADLNSLIDFVSRKIRKRANSIA